MATTSEHYLAILKASYEYEPQPDAEDELAIKENQLLFLLERTDDECVAETPGRFVSFRALTFVFLWLYVAGGR